MPFKTTRVIHPAFETHHRPVAEGGMTATATVLRYDHSNGVWDAETMRTTHPDPEPVVRPVRLQRQSAAGRRWDRRPPGHHPHLPCRLPRTRIPYQRGALRRHRRRRAARPAAMDA